MNENKHFNGHNYNPSQGGAIGSLGYGFVSRGLAYDYNNENQDKHITITNGTAEYRYDPSKTVSTYCSAADIK